MRLARDPVHRRRLVALGVAAATATAVGLVAGAAYDGSDPGTVAPTESPPRLGLSLERQVGELLVMSFDGPTAPGYIRRRLRDGQGGGVILFGANVGDAPALGRLTRSIQRVARGGALIAIDQEGGEIRNLPFAGPQAPQSALHSTAAAAAAARDAARGLRRYGINVNLAPVGDLTPQAGGGALAGRIYPGSPEQVSASVAAAIRAHDREGVAATVKHFPGLGRAAVNTDDGSETIEATSRELEADLQPFRAAVKADAPLVMAGHALYPALDPKAIASQSRVLLGDVLRDRLGYRGAVVTDSIEAQAVLDRSGVAAAAVRSIEAGADLVLMTGSGSWNLVYPAVLRRARRSPSFRARVGRSARRVLALKRRLGLRAEP